MKKIASIIVVAAIFTLINDNVAMADHPTVGFSANTAGPVTTISAATLPSGKSAIDIRMEYITFDPFSDSELAGFAEKEMHLHSVDSLTSASTGLAYGVTDDLTLSARIQFVKRSNIREGAHEEESDDQVDQEENSDGDHHRTRAANEQTTVHSHGDSSGLGDSTVLLQYRFHNSSSTGFSSSVLAGMKVPTGSTSETTKGGAKFGVEHQPGSGAWNPILGIAVSKSAGQLSYDANFLYTFAAEGKDNVDLGALFNYNAALSYRLIGGAQDDHHHEANAQPGHHDTNITFDLIVELNGEWRDKQEINGILDENTGGNTIMLSPGIRMTKKERWSAFLSAGLPVMQNLNGEQHKTNARILFGVGFGLN
jgi:hypothetical protein